MNKLTGILNKFAGKIPSFNIPWHKFSQYMDTVTPYLSQMNVIFPIDTFLTILILWGTMRAVMLVIWGISFVRKMLPF